MIDEKQVIQHFEDLGATHHNAFGDSYQLFTIRIDKVVEILKEQPQLPQIHDQLLEVIASKREKAERLVVEPPQDALDQVQNDISNGYIAACDELVKVITELVGKETGELL